MPHLSRLTPLLTLQSVDPYTWGQVEEGTYGPDATDVGWWGVDQCRVVHWLRGIWDRVGRIESQGNVDVRTQGRGEVLSENSRLISLHLRGKRGERCRVWGVPVGQCVYE